MPPARCYYHEILAILRMDVSWCDSDVNWTDTRPNFQDMGIDDLGDAQDYVEGVRKRLIDMARRMERCIL